MLTARPVKSIYRFLKKDFIQDGKPGQVAGPYPEGNRGLLRQFLRRHRHLFPAGLKVHQGLHLSKEQVFQRFGRNGGK